MNRLTNPARILPQRRRVEQGFTLIVTLMFMVVMTMLVVAGSQNSVMEERMSGYARDRAIAAEATHNVLDGFVQVTVIPQITLSSVSTGAPNSALATAMGGYCIYPSMSAAPNYRTMNWVTLIGQNPGVCVDPKAGDAQISTGAQQAVAPPQYFMAYRGNFIFPGSEGGQDVWNSTGIGYGMNATTYVLHNQDNTKQ